MRLMPSSIARWRMALTSLCSNVLPHSPPNCQVPRPMTETRRLDLPRRRYFMSSSNEEPRERVPWALLVQRERARQCLAPTLCTARGRRGRGSFSGDVKADGFGFAVGVDFAVADDGHVP